MKTKTKPRENDVEGNEEEEEKWRNDEKGKEKEEKRKKGSKGGRNIWGTVKDRKGEENREAGKE